MRHKVTSSLFITLALVGCQGEPLASSPAPTLSHSEMPFKQTPASFDSNTTEAPAETNEPAETSEPAETNEPVETNKPKETDKPKQTTEPTAPNKYSHHVQDDIKIISNPSGLLVAVNKTNTLPSDYTPANLVKPDIKFYFDEDIPKRYMREVAANAVEDLFTEAYANNMHILGASGYRSYDRQNAIFTRNANIYGFEEANTFSAFPGQSEHQTGLTLDVTTRSMNYKLVEEFGTTEEGKWLAHNAHKYGFIIRYLKGKEHLTGYTYEPWHLRYVGQEAAAEIYQNNWTLEEYHQAQANTDES